MVSTLAQMEAPQPKSKFKEFLEAFPFIHVLFVVGFAVVSTYFTVQLTQAHQAEKIERLERESVSRELFDERTKTIIDEQQRQRIMLEKLLEKK